MIEKTSNNPTSPDPSRAQRNAWARDLLQGWKAVATSNSNIYTYGFVSSASFPDTDNKKETDHATTSGSIASRILLGVLMIVSLVIQIVVPIAIVVTLPAPDGLCPNQAQPMTKIIGFTLCLYFVALTIGMCLNKLRGMGFLKLFCTHNHELLGPGRWSKWNRFFLDIGILANLISMAASGIAQYLLFIRNAEKDYVLLVLQSLAMQFVLAVDEKLMTTAWTSWTKTWLVNLVTKHEEERTNNLGVDTDVDIEGDQSNVHLDENTLKKVRLMYVAESTFLGSVCIIGTAWSIGLAYCM